MTQDYTLLVPIGWALLLGSIGISLAKIMKGEDGYAEHTEKVVIAFLALSFYPTLADGLDRLTQQLSDSIENLNRGIDLKAIVADAIQKAASPHATASSIWGALTHVWSAGIWGLINQVINLLFLISSFLLESARDVLWRILLLIFPIAGGVYPVFPRIMSNLAFYAVEISLWIPLLAILNLGTSLVAREALSGDGESGLYLFAIQLLTIVLTFRIPLIAQKMLSGGFSGDLGISDSVLKPVQALKKQVLR